MPTSFPAIPTSEGAAATPGDAGLDDAARRRGRRLAMLSHPAGMTHRNVYTDHLPTLALVGLGASETVVGLQRAFEPLCQLLQLPVLRTVGRIPKRRVLVAGQLVAVAGGLPLVAYGALAADAGGIAIGLALASLAAASIGLVASNTVWFPLLRSYVEPGHIGRFFGLLRTGWHVTLIGFYLGAQRWLEANPGAFGPLFGVATAAGLARVVLVWRLPERPSASGERMRIRDAFGCLRDERLRAYLAGMVLFGAARRAATPFVIVLMRRTLGLGDAEVVATTVAFFAGGFASLFAWGRAVDRLGPAPVFGAAAIGTAALFTALAALAPSGPSEAAAAGPWMIGFFFALAVLVAGFGVADTHVLFGLAPEREPTPMLVMADVATSVAYGLAPVLAGLALDAALTDASDPTRAYRALFLAAAAISALALLPVRRFRR